MVDRQFLEASTLVRYKAPKKIGNDRNSHKIANLKFAVITKRVDGPAQLVRWIKANVDCLGSVSAFNDFDMESFTLEFSETPGTEVFLTIPHATIKNFRLQRNKDADVFDLVFEAQIEADKSNAEFVCLRAGQDVALRLVQTESDQLWLQQGSAEEESETADLAVQADVAEQLPLPGAPEQPAPRRQKKPGRAIPRSLGGQNRKPLPKPRDAKKKGK